MRIRRIYTGFQSTFSEKNRIGIRTRRMYFHMMSFGLSFYLNPLRLALIESVMKSNTDSSLFSLLSRKSIIDPQALLKTCHKNCMYKTLDSKDEKIVHEVSTQSIPLGTDEQTQVSHSIESKETHSSMKKFLFINPYALIDRVQHGEQFLKFLHKQNLKLDLIYSNFLQTLQKSADDFLLALQQEHSLYGVYRRDLIWFLSF